MKLWQKIYFITLALLIITLNSVGFLFIQNVHNNLLSKEIDKSIMEQKFVAAQLSMATTQLLKSSNGSSAALDLSVHTFMDEYTASMTSDATYQIVDSQNNLIYTDLGFPVSSVQMKLQDASSERIKYIIYPTGDEYLLYICRLTNNNFTPLKIYYVKNISDLYAERKQNIFLFLKIDALICLVFAIVMLFMSKLLTKPIENLMSCTQQIASGEYANRVTVQSKDEFGTLAKQFNLMAETIENKMRELELSNEEKETFIHNFTHELKTPLTSIIGYANFIRTSKYDERLFFEASEYIYKEGKRLEQMAFKMMDLIYAREPNLEWTVVDMVHLLQDVRKILKAKLDEKQIELIIEGSPNILPVDVNLMKILFCNVVENAIKASSPYSQILVKIVKIEDKVIVSVIDAGMGIASEHLSKIGQPFYTVDPARTRKNNGAGIGLSICKKVAKAHGASFNIESELGKGTTISLTFSSSILPI